MSYFITGTDTGVGKTVVSAMLAMKLGFKYWKPIQSGLDGVTDSEWVAKRLGSQSVLSESYRLKAPLSPHAAANLDNIKIDLSFILSSRPAQPCLIEGAGGLFVPLNESLFMLDLILALQCPAVLVSRSGLGTINHTLLSLEAMRLRKISVAGVIMVGDPNPQNREAIAVYGGCSVLAQIPLLTNLSAKNLKSASDLIQLEEIL